MSTEPSRRLVLSGATMGTRWSATCYAASSHDALALETRLAVAVEKVDAQMSTWRPQSDLMRLNRMPVGEWFAIPDELAYVLAIGLGIGRASAGRFDMAVLAQVGTWGFGPPTLARERAPAARPAGAPIELDPAAGRARRILDVGLDLSGIAKGFAVDLMARALEAEGVQNYLVAIDGELQAAGRHLDGRHWQVGLEAPYADRRDVHGAITLADCSLATSGDYRHRRQVGNRWVSHTIDPRTGCPVSNPVASVTVRMPDCIAADAWATALLVAGETEGPRLADANNLDAIFLIRDGAQLRTETTGAFSRAYA